MKALLLLIPKPALGPGIVRAAVYFWLLISASEKRWILGTLFKKKKKQQTYVLKEIKSHRKKQLTCYMHFSLSM